MYIKFIIGLLLCCNFIYAQERSLEYNNVKNLLDSVTKTTQNYSNIKIEFENKIKNQAESIDQSTKGTLYLMNEKYKLYLLGIQQLFDGEKIYRILSNDSVIEVWNPKDLKEEGLSPSQILTLYKSGFNFQQGELKVIENRNIQIIKLYPENPELEPYHQIELGIDIDLNQVYYFIQYGKNGTNTEYYINNFETNISDIDSIFIYNPMLYEAYEKIDFYESE